MGQSWCSITLETWSYRPQQICQGRHTDLVYQQKICAGTSHFGSCNQHQVCTAPIEWQIHPTHRKCHNVCWGWRWSFQTRTLNEAIKNPWKHLITYFKNEVMASPQTFRTGRTFIRQLWMEITPLLLANYMMYRGREHVKKHRSIPCMEFDAEGLKLLYMQ